MGAHNNVHVPKEAWPNWTWFAIEFGIVLAASMVIGWQISDRILPAVAGLVGHAGALESWAGISIHSGDFKALPLEVSGKIIAMSNWIFYSIVGAVFGIWYIVIRGLVLKKKVLG